VSRSLVAYLRVVLVPSTRSHLSEKHSILSSSSLQRRAIMSHKNQAFFESKVYTPTLPAMRSYAFHPVDEPDSVISHVFHEHEWESERHGRANPARISSAVKERSLQSQASSSSIRSLDSTSSETSAESSPTSNDAPSDSQNKARNMLWKMSLKRSLFPSSQ
jgi:hypothetical protein